MLSTVHSSHKKVLVVAAHPDDEVLGCGGALAMHKLKGDEVQVLFMADGASARSEHNSEDLIGRQSCARQAAAQLGVDKLSFLDFEIIK